MRVLIAIGVPREREAGAAGVVLNHALELERRGHTVECWFLDDLLAGNRKLRRFDALRFASTVAKRIKKEPTKFDVVNIHAPWGCVYGWKQKKRWGRKTPPYVLTMQGSEERYVQMMRIEDEKGRAEHFNWKNQLWHRVYHQTMYDLAIRMASHGAVANREAQILAELKHGRRPGEFWYVPNGTEDKFFASREFVEKPEIKLLYVGTWVDRKGIYYLAEAFESLIKKNREVSLTIAGCGCNREQVHSRFAREVRERVTVLPFVSRDNLPQVYREHDVFVFPSLVEGMPLTLLEAMATGMPTVSTTSSGMPDVVEDGFNGLLVRAGGGKELAEAVEKLCLSRELRQRLGEAARETAHRYTWEKVTEKLEKVLLLAIEESQKKG